MDTHEQKEVTEGRDQEVHSSLEWERQGDENARESRWEEAEHCYSESLRLWPEYIRCWEKKGRCLWALNRYEEAIAVCDSALAIHRRHAFVWITKGLSLQGLHRFEEAVCCLAKALHRDPTSVDAWWVKGHCLRELGCQEEALECYDQAAKLDPQKPAHLVNKADVLYGLGRFEEALRCCDEALELAGHDALAWNNKGDALRGLGRLNEALGCYGRSIESDPELADPWRGKALTEEALGQDERAAESRARSQALGSPRDMPQISHLSSEEIRLLVKGIYRPEEEDAKVGGPGSIEWTAPYSGARDEVVYTYPGSVEYYSELRDALNAHTWGEFRTAVGPDEFETLMEHFDDSDEPRPQDSDAFDADDVPGFLDGEWPAWPTDDLMPQDILDIWGEENYDRGLTCWTFWRKDVDEINAELRRRGYEVLAGSEDLIPL